MGEAQGSASEEQSQWAVGGAGIWTVWRRGTYGVRPGCDVGHGDGHGEEAHAGGSGKDRVSPPSQLCMALHSHLPIPESGPLLNVVPGRPPWK